ncbi:MAG: bifunctional riboflavin kinase/FAD synthetase [Acholeplasmatales bacterium]|nr:bifunctional riboflavin kinase/FAD synthetase [Acholeplasmatales bacterium]
MKTVFIRDKNFKPLEDNICCAIGNFDGVHKGHQKLIEESKKHGYKSGVITLYPHPSVFLKKIPNFPLITPIEAKIKVLESFNIDYLIIIEFDNDVANMSKEEFMDCLKTLNVKALVSGYDFTFGKAAEGDVRDLASNFEFYEVKKHSIDGVRVSSTYIRELLAAGNVVEAQNQMGRPHKISGKVVYGNQKGNRIGFPTANIDYTNYFLPAGGVYLVNVFVKDKKYIGMCNIGNNPTINYSATVKVEVHIIDFDGVLYGTDIDIEFIEKIREEYKFDSKEALVEQLNKDRELCIKKTAKF